MSDYLYLLENHLSAAQHRVTALLVAAAATAGQTLYLTGGAMRDLLGGFPTRDLDFTLCGNPMKLDLAAVRETGGTMVRKDDARKLLAFHFADGVTAKIGMARSEVYAKPGGKPKIEACDIRDDLKRRDFTVNAIAVGLNRSARGMLVDPANGLADLESRELRTANSGAFADEPVRMARLIRFKHRLNFTIAERTEQQFQSAYEAGMQNRITPSCWFEELCAWGNDAAPSAGMRELEERHLLPVAGINHAAVHKWEKLKRSIAFPGTGWVDCWRCLYLAMTDGAGVRARAALAAEFGLDAASQAALKALVTRARKLEAALSASSVRRPWDMYKALRPYAPDEILYALNTATQRVAQDRLRVTLQKHLHVAIEMRGASDAEIALRLNEKPKKVEANPPAAE